MTELALEEKIEAGKWVSFTPNLKRNGVFAVRIIDDLLEHENWPVHVIVIRGGTVKMQIPVYESRQFYVYTLPNMEGWAVDDVLQWLSYSGDDEEIPSTAQHEIMFIN